jgi:hypothetical protein
MTSVAGALITRVRFHGACVKVVDNPSALIARVTGLVCGVGEPGERGRQLPQGAGLERVDAALAGALGGDDAGAFEGLQMLGRLRLARLSELGQDADRTRPLGQ